MRYLFLLSFVFFLLACSKKQPENCVTDCDYQGAIITFTGYTVDEIDTVYLRSYRRNGLFDSLLKETLLSTTDSVEVPGVGVKGLSSISIDIGFDYELFIPSTTQTFKIAVTHKPHVCTTECDRQRSTVIPWEGETITGGNYEDYDTDPYHVYIVLKK